MSNAIRSWNPRIHPIDADAPYDSLRHSVRAGPEAAFRTAMQALLGLFPNGAALLAGDGTPLAVNEGFQRLLTRHADAEQLTRKLATRLGWEDAGDMPRLRTQTIDLESVGLGRAVLAVVEEDGASPPDEVLRERFRLTRKEIVVARLLAEGRSNTGVASSLCISPHTARHHTERILTKLEVSSRAEVGPCLRAIGFPR